MSVLNKNKIIDFIKLIKEDASTLELSYKKKTGFNVVIPSSILLPIILVGVLEYNYGDEISNYLSNSNQTISQNADSCKP